MRLLSGDPIPNVAASFENAGDDEYVVWRKPWNGLHLREHRQREIVEAAASARANEGDPTADICGGNFVEQFSRVGELATAHVEGYEVRSNYVETRETFGD